MGCTNLFENVKPIIRLKSDLSKVIASIGFLSILSLMVMIYNIVLIINKDDKTKENVEERDQDGISIHAVVIFITSLIIFVNLLMCQGALDLASIDLYFWPDPAVIKVWWILVYVPLSIAYFCGTVSCFYSAITGLKDENLFISENDNEIAWGMIYLTGDIIFILSIYFVPNWYSRL